METCCRHHLVHGSLTYVGHGVQDKSSCDRIIKGSDYVGDFRHRVVKLVMVVQYLIMVV